MTDQKEKNVLLAIERRPYNRFRMGRETVLERSAYLFTLIGVSANESSLAYVEMRLILARLMWNFDIDFANEEGKNWVDGLLGFNLWNKPALRVKLTPRSIRV